MARKKKKAKRLAGKRSSVPPQLTKGMPARDSVEEVSDFVSPQGVPYKILKTTETDTYDPPLQADKKPAKPHRVP